MEILKEALLQLGFVFDRNCPTCGGLGFIYKRNRIEAMLKISADTRQEMSLQVGNVKQKNSYLDNGRIVIPTLFRRQNYNTVEEAVNAIKKLIEPNDNTNTEQ